MMIKLTLKNYFSTLSHFWRFPFCYFSCWYCLNSSFLSRAHFYPRTHIYTKVIFKSLLSQGVSARLRKTCFWFIPDLLQSLDSCFLFLFFIYFFPWLKNLTTPILIIIKGLLSLWLFIFKSQELSLEFGSINLKSFNRIITS